MSTPQDPARRAKQKRRRTKKLEEWRVKQDAKKTSTPEKTAAAKAPAKKKSAPAKA